MTAILLPEGKQSFTTAAGVPLVGGKLFTWDAGTSNPRLTWADAAQTAPNTNPIILDARGEAVIFWDGAYRVQLQDSTGAIIWTVDGISAQVNASLIPAQTNTYDIGSPSFTWRNLYLGASGVSAVDSAGNVGIWVKTAAEAAVTVTNYVYEPRNVKRYGATGDGVTNDSVAFAQATLAYPYTAKYVPEGTYVITSFGALDGWYGPGVLLINGQRIFIPQTMEQLSTIKRLQELLSRIRGNFQDVTLVGDSISDYYYVSAERKHWFSMLRDSINFIQNNGDFELTTNFDDPYIKTYTLGGATSFGATGPLGRSLILGVGGYIEFTGAFDNVDCFFDRAPGAGSLAFTYNGGAAYKTISCAGAAQSDYQTTLVAGFVPTSTVSGTHRITCTGAPVTITGLCRLLRVYGLVSAQTRFARIARSGYSTTQFNSNTILASVKAVGCTSQPTSNTTQQSLFLVALGTNNMYNLTNQTSVTIFLVDLLKIFATLSEAGAIVYIQPAKPGRATLTGSEYEAYMAAAKIACDAFNVPMVALNGFPFNDAGYTQDNLHPNDAGNLKYLEIIADAISKLPLTGPAQIAQTRDLGNFLHTVNPGGTAVVNYGPYAGAYYNGTQYIATKSTATGYLVNGLTHQVYHDSGLVPGNVFVPTLVYTINSSKQVIFEQNTQTKGTLFVGPAKTINLLTVPNTYANDAAAAAGGVAIGDFYRNGSILMIRVT